MDAIVATGLTKHYKSITAVDQLNLSIPQGELFSLLGINGAGKTTALKMLSCLLPPTSGDALLLGHSIVKEPFESKAQINISPQETAVAPNLTVTENLELICGIYGYSKAERKERAAESIRDFSMEPMKNQKAKTLSGGWSRRLSIAMALITQPKILFLDEPTLGLDVLARRELWEIIAKRKGHITIVLTTHYLEEAEALSHRIGIMAKGSLVALGTPEELKSRSGQSRFEDAFVALCKGGSSL